MTQPFNALADPEEESGRSYPAGPGARDRWILLRRDARQPLDPQVPWAFLAEEEPDESGGIQRVATVFLTNRECPWRCVMCDLWRNTRVEETPEGAIPAQIDHALARLGPARHIKLYNSGSFFDPHAIPPRDYAAIAARVRGFERVIVENHPALTGESCLRFRDLLVRENCAARLEVAMGLETAHPGVLEKLNKRITLDQFADAAAFLRRNEIALRVFILVQPPFLPAGESREWAERSLDFAFGCGARAVTLIPTRAGNGAMEALAESGEFTPPDLATLESAFEYGLSLGRGLVFADTWNLPRPIDCVDCGSARAARLRQMNLAQRVLPEIGCERCGGRG